MHDTAYFQATGRFIYACERLNALIAERSAPGAAIKALPASVLATQAQLAAQQAQLAAQQARILAASFQPTQEELDALTAQAEAAIQAAQAAS